MPYNYVGLGATRVQNDFRTLGAYSGTSTTAQSGSIAAYAGGRSVIRTSAGNSSGTLPGQVFDAFAYQVSSKSVAELYTQGGWALYWRAMTWIDGSVTSAPIFDGTNYWLPTTTAVTGNWIGKSPDGNAWTFSQVVGSQPTGTVGYGLAQNGTFGWGELGPSANQTLFRYYVPSTNSMTTTLISSTAQVRPISGAAKTDETRFALCGGTRIWATSDITSTWTEYTLGSTWLSAVNIPNTNVWLFGGGAGSIARSTDNLATAPVLQTARTADLTVAVASPTAVILAGTGDGTNAYRSTDNGATWANVTLPGTNVRAGAYGNGVFVLGSYITGQTFVSEDNGLTWAAFATNVPITGQYVQSSVTDGIKFANGKFWLSTSNATGANYLLASSIDGKTWELVMSAAAQAAAQSAPCAQGVFSALNISGVPTSSSRASAFTASTLPITQNSTIACYNNGAVSFTFTTKTLGVNQWHEYQIIGRASATTNEFNLTYVVDDVSAGPYVSAVFASSSAYPLWFTVSRGNFFTFTSDIVFYDFPTAQDPGVLGPDLRIYYDQPADDVEVEWSPSVEDATSNASMVAVPSITNATTSILESGEPKLDQYTMQATQVPASHTILSTKNSAYFSRAQAVTAAVTVGVESGGVVADGVLQGVASPVGSWTLVNNQLDNNPQTGAAWTRSQLNSSVMRVNRIAAEPGGDPLFLNVGLLAQFNGTDGSTTTVDSSLQNSPIVLSGAAALTSTQVKFGSTSVGLNLANQATGTVQVARNSLLNFGASDFTVEGWFYSTITGSELQILFSTGTTTAVNSTNVYLYRQANGTLRAMIYAATQTQLALSTATMPLASWVHCALVRFNNQWTIYINGVGSAAGSNTTSINSPDAYFSIGGGLDGSSRFQGYIDDFRVTGGIARYTANFTPPTAAFPDFY